MDAEKNTAQKRKMVFIRESQIDSESMILLKIKTYYKIFNMFLNAQVYSEPLKARIVKKKVIKKRNISYVKITYTLCNNEIKKRKNLYIEKTIAKYIFNDELVTLLLNMSYNPHIENEQEMLITTIFNNIKTDFEFAFKNNKMKKQLSKYFYFFSQISILYIEETKKHKLNLIH